MALYCPFSVTSDDNRVQCTVSCQFYDDGEGCNLATLSGNINALTQTMAEISTHLMNIAETMAMQRMEAGK